MFYVLCVLVVAWQCFMVALDTQLGGLGQLFHNWHVVAISLANALLLLSPYWLLRRRWRWLVWIPLTLLTVWCLMQVCYCRAYDDLMPWQSLTLTQNVNSTLAATTLSLLRWQDLLILVPYLLLVAVCLLGRRTREDGERIKPFLLSLAGCLLLSLAGYLVKGENYEKRFLHNFSNRGYFAQNGLIPYGAFSLYQALFNNHKVTDEERAMVDRFLAEDCPNYTDNSYSADGRRNLVLIIVESLHTWPIGMQVDGREVTPVMNSLVAGDSVIYAPHVLFQTSHGHSSDAHFIYNTGLLPLRDGVVAVHHGDGPYPTLAAALSGYDCREIICTPGVNWNQNVTARTYGFDTLYTREHLAAALKRQGNIDDAALVDYVGGLLPSLHQPFFLEMVTMTMHAPYTDGKLPPSWITASDTLNAEARGYLNCVHLTDSCIGVFINDLQRHGLAGNTVLAIVSDHTQLYRNRVMGISDYDAVPDDWGIPLIIAGCDTTLRYDAVIGQVDVYPTLLDVMGANAYPWKGLGHSILRYPVAGAIQPRNMSVIGDSTALIPQQRKAWDISRLLIFDRVQRFPPR
jgi:phosphoglycerol transferase MdoB-like AlkP superfamily enzyme